MYEDEHLEAAYEDRFYEDDNMEADYEDAHCHDDYDDRDDFDPDYDEELERDMLLEQQELEDFEGCSSFEDFERDDW